MKRNKKLVSLLIIISMLLQLAPVIICEAAESVYDLIINPETPLDEVYFYSNETDSENKEYYYGFSDGKVSVMDENYNLIKKTDFDMINMTKLVKVKGVPAFTASKNVDGKYLYGIVSFEGKTIVEPEYSHLLINPEHSLIITTKEVNGNFLEGLWDLECNEILPCKYRSIEFCDKQDDKILLETINVDKTHSIILDGKEIWTGDEPEEDYYYSYSFSEFEGQKCVKIHLYLDDLSDISDIDNKEKVLFVTYKGDIIKSFSASEWDDYDNINNINFQDRYELACENWLNNESEKGKQHVIDFFKSKGIELSNIKNSTSFMKNYKVDTNNLYYFIIITGEYPKSEEYQNYQYNDFTSNALTYIYLYDENKNCIISGRSFGKNIYRYLLSDEGKMFYLDEDTMQAKELFEVDDTILTYVSNYNREETDMERHQLYYSDYKHEIISECFDNTNKREKRNYVYINGKGYLCDNYIDKYCFIKNETLGTDIYVWNNEWDKKVWEFYTHIDIPSDKVKQSDKAINGNDIYLKDKEGEIIFIGKEKTVRIPYNGTDISETSSIYNIIGNQDCKLIIFEDDDVYQYYYANINNKEFFKLPVDSELSLKGIIEVDDNLYTWTRNKIIVINKKTLKINIIAPYQNFDQNIQSNNNKENKEYINSLFLLDGKIYIKYNTMYNDDNNFYGIMDLSGEKKIPLMKDDNSDNKELMIVGDYIIIENNIYDSSFNLLTNKGNYMKYFDEENLVILYDNNQSSNFIPKLINEKTGNTIYDFANGESIPNTDDVEKLNKYYAMYFYVDSDRKVMLIDSSSDKVVFYGKAFIHKNDKQQKIVVFGKPENISLPTPKPSKKPSLDENTPSLIPASSPAGDSSEGNTASSFISGGGVATVYTATPVPSQTPATTQTAIPIITPVPDATSTPVVTPEPVKTIVPVTTPEPVKTIVPVTTPESNTTSTPVVTPEISAIPEPSASTDTETDNKTDLEKSIKKGVNFTNKKTKAVYKVINTGKNKSVEYINSTKKNAKNATVPATVQFKGKTFKVVSINKEAFKNNKNLKSVKIGKNVKTIGKEAFWGCKKLDNVKMGKNIVFIEANAFNKCTSLTKITIPVKVEKIGKKAFYKCKNLQYIHVKTKKLKTNNIGKKAFGNGYATPRVKSDKSVWKQYQDIFTSKGLSKETLFIVNPAKLMG